MATVNTPAMEVKLVGRGSQYAISSIDSTGESFDGAKNYGLNIPKNMLVKEFWQMVTYGCKMASESITVWHPADHSGNYLFLTQSPLLIFMSMETSMSRKGCSPDNAACEGVFGRLKTEMYHGREWSGITPENFMQHVDAYIRWYNEKRIKLSLGAVSPEMYRRQLGIPQ